jgi:hypothetical protein
MVGCLIQWLKDNTVWATFWISFGILIIGIVTMVIMWKVRPLINYIKLGSTWGIERIGTDKIRVKGQVAIASLVNVKGEGILKLKNTKIKIKMININQVIGEFGKYDIELDGEYKGAFDGIVILGLRIYSMGKKSRYFKKGIRVSIPDKLENPQPPEIFHMGFHD